MLLSGSGDRQNGRIADMDVRVKRARPKGEGQDVLNQSIRARHLSTSVESVVETMGPVNIFVICEAGHI